MQIHGGYSYIEDFGIKKMYRDARIQRIWEGTNEIHRLVVPGWVFRKAAKNELPLFSVAMKLQSDLLTMPAASPSPDDEPLGYQKKLLGMAKKIFILICGATALKYGKAITDEEEILGLLSNIAIEIHAMESGLLRAQKALNIVGEEKSSLKIAVIRVYVNDTMKKIEDYSSQTLVAMETGDTLTTYLSALKKLARLTPINTVASRRQIANAIIEAEKYVC